MQTTRARILFVLAALLLSGTASVAQPGDPGPDPDPGTQIPFDGGLTLVVAASVAYAAKKGLNKRKGSAQIKESKG